jgi:hypothetical protein
MALPPTPLPLVALPVGEAVTMGGQAAATVAHFVPSANIPPFGMCNSPANPAVIAATATALGVHTPAPCLPAISTPWTPGRPDVLVNGDPVLTADCQLMCAWAGVITINAPGQATVSSG